VGAKLNATGAAPVGLLPLGLGVALGVALVGLAAKTQATGRKRLVVAAVTFAILTVAAEHAWLYRDYRQQWWNDSVREPRLAIFRTEAGPLSPAAYYAREIQYAPRQPLLWAMDGALLVAAAVVVVLAARRGAEGNPPLAPP
jgi:hypothetical protein